MVPMVKLVKTPKRPPHADIIHGRLIESINTYIAKENGVNSDDLHQAILALMFSINKENPKFIKQLTGHALMLESQGIDIMAMDDMRLKGGDSSKLH